MRHLPSSSTQTIVANEKAVSRTIWTPTGISPQGPLYVAIADALARDIRSAALKPGERLPTHRDLARTLGVNVVTVTRAYAEAARRGLVDGEVGRGTFVRDQRATGYAFKPIEDDRSLVDFHFNVPHGDPSVLELGPVLEAIAREPRAELLAVGHVPAGLPEHRAAGAAWLSRAGIDASPERVLVCGGAQHAMAVAFAALTQPRDLVLAEELTYPGMISLAKLLNLRLHPVPIDERGLVPEALDEACAKHHPKALYCMPNLQNPTGALLPEDRRRAIAEIARRHDVAVVEDDTTGFLCSAPPPAIGRFAPERVYFVSSTSKSLAPGLRVGYLLAPASDAPASKSNPAVERLTANLAAISWMTPPLTAELASRWIRDGSADRMVEWKRAEAVARRALFDDLVGPTDTRSHPESSYVWLPLPSPWRTDDFVAQARMRGVVVTASPTFLVGRGPTPHAVRVSLATPPSRAEVERGCRALAEVLASGPECSHSIC